MKTIALLSLLAEPPQPGPLTRSFRGEPVLHWTLRRLGRVESLAQRGVLAQRVVLAWDDQLQALGTIDAAVRSCGPRASAGRIESIAAAQRWCDGWRGGLLQSAPFDVGFLARHFRQALLDTAADACVVIDPSAGLVDPQIVRDVIAAAAGTRDFYFTAAAPGLGGVLMKRALLDGLCTGNLHAGRLLHYLPESPVLDPLTSDACVTVPLPVCRTPRRFTLDSRRQIDRIEQATLPLNGTLISSEAEALVRRVEAFGASPAAAGLPREVTLELTTRRTSRPTFSAGSHLAIERPDLAVEQFGRIVEQLSSVDDLRLTLGGVGDPLLHPRIAELLEKLGGVHTVQIETDLLDVGDALIAAIVANRIEVVTVNLPATSPATYAKIMGIDAMPKVLDKVRRLLIARQTAGRGVPLIVPRFVKLGDNFAEMEQWHDTWLRALGSAVIDGPSNFAGRIPELGVADMTPPLRRPCARIAQRMTILSDGSIVACEQDVTGQLAMGHVDRDSIAAVWQSQFGELRERHQTLARLPILCGNCREWHRP